MTDKHTPGPWKNQYPRIYSKTGSKLIEVDEYMACTICDAALIAAAPDLLEALQGILGYFDSGNSVSVSQATIKAGSDEIKAARAAIAKATGKDT